MTYRRDFNCNEGMRRLFEHVTRSRKDQILTPFTLGVLKSFDGFQNKHLTLKLGPGLRFSPGDRVRNG